MQNINITKREDKITWKYFKQPFNTHFKLTIENNFTWDFLNDNIKIKHFFAENIEIYNNND